MKMRGAFLTVAVLFFAACAAAAFAQEPIIYPAKGQSELKMAKDKGECQQWAKKDTGIDPVAAAMEPVTAEPVSSGPKGERLKGGGRGAAGGAAVGAISGDAGKGAAIGAIAGGMRAGMKSRQEKKAEKAGAEQQAQAQHSQKLSTYNRAFCACMEGRGYTVK